MPEFSIQLKILREERDLTQEQLAVKASMSAMTVSKLERGKHAPTPRTMRRLAIALGLSGDYFRKGAEEERETLELKRGVVDGLRARAALENSTLDEWLERQASLTVTVYDGPPQPERPVRGGSRLSGGNASRRGQVRPGSRKK